MSLKSILVLGGAGYIGSHMVYHLIESGYSPIVFDNLSTGHREFIEKGIPFIPGDLSQPRDIEAVFTQYPIHAVMHFAASSLVEESVKNPIKYYQNNVVAACHLLNQMIRFRIPHLIFSSTAAVYGNPLEVPITEKAKLDPINPYGRTKLMIEQMIQDVSKNNFINYAVLRYFNAAGCSERKQIGELHDPETHLIPNLLGSLNGSGKVFTLYGDDYPTKDGTCLRDFIHVQDLCDAHVKALQYLERGGQSEVFNVGTGHGYSVAEVIKRVELVTERLARVEIGPRRAGDPAVLVASCEKANKVLNWKAKRNLDEILKTAWHWYEGTHKLEFV